MPPGWAKVTDDQRAQVNDLLLAFDISAATHPTTTPNTHVQQIHGHDGLTSTHRYAVPVIPVCVTIFRTSLQIFCVRQSPPAGQHLKHTVTHLAELPRFGLLKKLWLEQISWGARVKSSPPLLCCNRLHLGKCTDFPHDQFHVRLL